jgi:hypothetical protein
VALHERVSQSIEDGRHRPGDAVFAMTRRRLFQSVGKGALSALDAIGFHMRAKELAKKRDQ